MAIIPDVPHVSVSIVVDGRELPEYLDEDESEAVTSDSTTKYVESVSGSKFIIRTDLTGMELRDLEGGDCITTYMYLDGKCVESLVFKFLLRRNIVHDARGARYRERGSWKQRDFLFADLVTSEDAAFSKPRPDLKDLGTITVKLYNCLLRNPRGKSRQDTSHMPDTDHGNIHEKHLKGQAISQQAKLGEASDIASTEPQAVEYLNGGAPFAVFNFRYRSRLDLQKSYLIPRSPSPIPLEDRPEESLNREELLELLRRQKARQEERVAIKKELKRERVDDESDDDLVVISSRPPAPKLKSSMDADTGVETFDLTDD